MSNEFKSTRRPSRKPKGADALQPDDESLPGGWSPMHRGWGWFGKFVLGLIVLTLLVLAVLPLTPWFAPLKKFVIEKLQVTKIVTHKVPTTVIKEVIKEVPAPPPPLPANFVPRKEVDVATLYNGITIQTHVDTSEGTYATLEREDRDAYKVEFKLNLRVPKANFSVAELGRVNSHLPKMLPGLPALLTNGKISGFYHKLYENKVNGIEKNLTRLNKLLDRHNFFDCETILELKHPKTQRMALLIQSDMDVVADGSDGDRMAVMDSAISNSDYYQPFTSYEWAKTDPKSPNPLLARWQARYDGLKKDAAAKGISAARKAELKAQMHHLDLEITQMKKRSSLIAEKDPFIVLSLLFRDYPRVMPQAPGMGDYCAVIYDGTIYPAICGDYGPSMKMGEASLLIAKTINEKATPYVRGSDDLKVTYLVFPGTAKRPFGPPNLDEWYEKVNGYLTEIGGLGDGYKLHKWENPFPPKTPPAAPATDPLAGTAPAATPGTPAASGAATPGADAAAPVKPDGTSPSTAAESAPAASPPAQAPARSQTSAPKKAKKKS